MTSEQKWMRLKVLAEEHVQAFFDEAADKYEDEYEVVGWVGDGAVEMMADAMLAVLRASRDAQEYLQREGLLRQSL